MEKERQIEIEPRTQKECGGERDGEREIDKKKV